MPTKTWTLIEEQVVGTPVASIVFGSGGTLTQIYKDLVVEIIGTVASDGVSPVIKFNNDATNYSATSMYGTGSSALSTRASSQAKAWVTLATGFSSTQMSMAVCHIMSYANTNVYKTMLSRTANANGSTAPGTEAVVNLWQSKNAITSLVFVIGNGTNYASGTTFRLWGVIG